MMNMKLIILITFLTMMNMKLIILITFLTMMNMKLIILITFLKFFILQKKNKCCPYRVIWFIQNKF